VLTAQDYAFTMTKINFWRRISKILRRFPWMVAGLYIIWRMLQTKYTMGAVGIIFNNEGQILLVEHVFHPKLPWGLPGGWVSHSENPAEAVQREMQEELSLDVEVGPLLLAEFHEKYHLDLAYLCKANDAIGALSYELLSYRWFSTDDLPLIYPFQSRAIQKAIEFKQSYGLDSWQVQP